MVAGKRGIMKAYTLIRHNVRIASLQPFATDILARYGVGLDLIAVTHLCEVPKSCGKVAVVTRSESQPFTYSSEADQRLACGLSSYSLDIKQLLVLEPDVIIADVQESEPLAFISWAEGVLGSTLNKKCRIFNAAITSLVQMSDVVEEIGALVGSRSEARALASKTQAQLMAWADSFFDRCKGKKVVVLSSVDPIVVAERWIPDMVRMLGAKSIERTDPRLGKTFSWEEIVAARPDVIVVAPEGASLQQSVRAMPVVQRLPGWESLPAVKRGEVIFCAGSDLYRPGVRFLRGAAVLVSAVAGLDSGYITERDEYFKVRYLELHRHKFL